MQYHTFTQKSNGYSEWLKSKNHGNNYKAFIGRVSELVLHCNYKPIGVISTVVEQHWTRKLIRTFQKAQYVMYLDCDTTEMMLATSRSLKNSNIGYAAVQSSEDHFWVITDVVDNMRNIISIALATPGVDSKWIYAIKNNNNMVIRAVAFPNKVPCFPRAHSLTNPQSIKLFNELQEHFDKPEIKTICYNMTLAESARNGTIFSMAADPKFDL